MINIDVAIHDPASIFKSPHDVIDEKSLTRKEKIDILRRWAYDEREMAVAEEENMLGHGAESKNVLDEILKSLLELGVDRDQEDAPPTKQG